MNFLSGVYSYIKVGIAAIGGLCSIGVLGYGIYAVVAVSSATGGVLIGVGGVWLLNSIFNFADSTGVVKKIKQEVDRLEQSNKKYEEENIKLEGNITELAELKNKFTEENKQLIESIKKSTEQIDKLESLKDKYLKQNEIYKQLIEKEEKQINDLESSVLSLNSIKNEINSENENLKTMIAKNETLISSLEETQHNYAIENEKLQEANKQNAEQIEQLKLQNIKLRELFNESKELLLHLAKVGDLFDQFSTTIGHSVVDLNQTSTNLINTHDEYEKTLSVLKALTDKLKNKTFTDFDADGDGIITKDEFDNAIKEA